MFVLSLWLPDEAKIETKQEEDEMDDGSATADLRCFDKTCSQQRHRNIGEIEIEQIPDDTRMRPPEICECITADHERTDSLVLQAREGYLDLVVGAGMQ